MQLGQRHRQVIGLAICAIAFAVAVLVPRGDGPTALPALRSIAAVADQAAVDGAGGSIAAIVSWPVGAAERADICVVVFDEDGAVASDQAGHLEPIPGQPVAARWTVEGLAAGRYTVYVAPCTTPSTSHASVEPQYLGGSHRAAGASWVDVADGARVDVGTIVLTRSA